MKIGINGRFLVARRTGVQRAAYNLVKKMIELDRTNDYILFASNEQLNEEQWQYDNVKIVPSKIIEGENLRNHYWEQFILPKLARKYNIDILHSPANTAPLFYRGPSVIHIHDLCFIVNPQWYSFSFRTAYNLIVPRIAKKATRIITNSNNSRNDLFKFVKLPASRVNLIYWAVDDYFIDLSPKQAVKEDFILYVGSLEPRKNIKLLLKGYEHLRLNNPEIKTKMIIIGTESKLFAKARLKVNLFKDDIIFKGFVPDIELKDTLRRAKMLVYPSLYEGFGLPPLEAMASGTPVITTKVSSLPEVVGDSAVLVSPFDYKELAMQMRELILDKALADDYIRRGLKWVKQFNWNRVATETLGVLNEAYLEGKSQDIQHLPYEKWQQLQAMAQE